MTDRAGFDRGQSAWRHDPMARQQESLVCAQWDTLAAHERYRAEFFPALRERAGLDRDLESITGHVVELDPAWAVR